MSNYIQLYKQNMAWVTFCTLFDFSGYGTRMIVDMFHK